MEFYGSAAKKYTKVFQKHTNLLFSCKDITLDDVSDDINWYYENVLKRDKPEIVIVDSYKQLVSMVKCEHLAMHKQDVRLQLQFKMLTDLFTRSRFNTMRYLLYPIPFSTDGLIGVFEHHHKIMNEVPTDFRIIAQNSLVYLETIYKICNARNRRFKRFFRIFDKGVYAAFFSPTKVFLCKLPKKILLDDDDRLHSVKEGAVQFRDGHSWFYIHGVHFEQPLWEKVVTRKIRREELFSIKNVDQRFVAMNHYGFDKLFRKLNPILVDNKSKKGNKLYKFSFDNTKLYMLLYPDTVNNNPRFSFVPPGFNTADEAMAWKHNMTEEEYSRLSVEG